jgi:hypothetical protein
MGMLFIPHMIYEHEKPWWIDIDRGKLLIRPPVLSGDSTSSNLVVKQEELAKEIMNLALQSIFIHTPKGSLM